jgi:hypothetical protein
VIFAELLDVTITAEGKKLKAHRVILSAASTYFRVSLMYTFQYLKYACMYAWNM